MTLTVIFMQRRSQLDIRESGRISFLDVLSAVPPFSEGLLAVYMNLDRESQIVIIGDSIIKHIIPKKISSRNVTKITFPGKTADEISNQLDQIKFVCNLIYF